MVLQQGLPRNKEFEPVSLDRLRHMAESLEDLIDVQIRPIPKGEINEARDPHAASPGNGRAEY